MDLFLWIIAHPLISIPVMIAVPVLIVSVNAVRRSGAVPEAPASEPGPTIESAAPQPEPAAAPSTAVELAPSAGRVAQAPEPGFAPEPEVVPVSAPEREPAPEPEVVPVSAPEPEVVPVSAPERTPAPPRVGLRARLAKTRDGFVGRLGGLLGGRTVDAGLLDELEALLFTADLGVGAAESLLEAVRRDASGGDADAVRGVLREAILEKLARVQAGPAPTVAEGPLIVLVLGVNGSGKTTTIGKLAARYVAEGKRVILGAGDTFRAAAIEQLQVWGERTGCEVIAGKAGGDPTAIAFDTAKAAKARGMDVAIIDTAGRLQTKKPLMEELGKMSRVLGREVPGAPHQTLLVLDANTGQNAISQARLFSEVTAVTDLALTKLDGTAKGGVIIGLADDLGIPVRYVGVGEAVEDLRDFDAAEFVDALFQED